MDGFFGVTARPQGAAIQGGAAPLFLVHGACLEGKADLEREVWSPRLTPGGSPTISFQFASDTGCGKNSGHETLPAVRIGASIIGAAC